MMECSSSQSQFEAWFFWNQLKADLENRTKLSRRHHLTQELLSSTFPPTSKICEEIIKKVVRITSENKQTPDNSAGYSSTVSFPFKGMTMAIKTRHTSLVVSSSFSSVRPQAQLSSPKDPLEHHSHAIRG